jgi:2-dehydro-3-deoxyphosphogluconate aldolase/(4S)-4-hydroxy-2-oxoglutarate aldolase
MFGDTAQLIAAQLMSEEGVIAVIDAPVADRVFDWAIAVAKGGIRFLGIPVTFPKVTEVTSDLADEANLTVGVSGVLTHEHVSVAIAAGAEFVLSPICDPDLIKSARDRGLTVIASGATPTELLHAMQAGADLVALCPAAALGGPSYVKELMRQLPTLPLAVFGGVDVEGAPSYLEQGAIAAVVDRGLFPETEDPAATEIITMRAVALMEVVAEVRGDEKRESMTDILTR